MTGQPPRIVPIAAAKNRRSFLRVAGAALGLGAAGLAVVACDPGDGGQDRLGEADPVDVGFCTDMAFHHEQALAMCQRVLGRDTGGPVQAAAAEILQNQSFERGLMFAWLGLWGRSTAPPEQVMAWMGMAMPAEQMPGLASDVEMSELSGLEGRAKGRRFLELMRAHHVGGVPMAEFAAREATNDRVQRLAGQMASAQTYEIGVFDALLATTYAEV